jgi:hypothetical protein
LSGNHINLRKISLPSAATPAKVLAHNRLKRLDSALTPGQEAVDIRWFAGITGHHQRLAAVTLDLIGQGIKAFAPPGLQHHRRAFACQGQGRGPTDTGALAPVMMAVLPASFPFVCCSCGMVFLLVF